MSIFSEWFPELGEAEARKLVTLALEDIDEFVLPNGRHLLFEGDINSDVMFYIVSGTIRVTVGSEQGDIVLAMLGPGNFVGEMGFLQGTARCAALNAEGDTVLKVISRRDLAGMLKGVSPVVLLMLDQLIDRLRAMSLRASEAPLAEVTTQ